MAARFTGLIPPMLTPLDADERLDRRPLQRFVDFLIDGGVDGLFILGSSGEGPTLRPSVKLALVEATVEAVRGRVPVIAGVLEPATARVIDELRSFAGRGLDGYVVTTPFYFPGYNDDELLEHFKRASDASDGPILAYNIPQTTKVALTAALVRRLAQLPRLAGIKDSSGNWAEFQAMLFTRTDPDFVVLQGNQSMCAISLLAGGDGLIPAHANVYPRLLADMVAAARRGDVAGTLAQQAKLDEILGVRGRANLHSLKVTAKALGLMDDHISAPLPRLTSEEAEKFLAASVEAGLRLPTAAAV